MNINTYDIAELLTNNSYPGRGIIIGESADGKNALIAYFIMGRSVNSRNRIFERFNGGMRTRAFDESKLVDPSLIIYNPYLALPDIDIVTNGDQTNTIYDYLVAGGRFESALKTREFEPDYPNYTPRISGICYYRPEEKTFSYKLSILKSNDGDPLVCNRYFYEYQPKAGFGHFIHTYKCDGDPIPSFYGEPEKIQLPNTAEELADILWSSLNNDNKVSLFVRSVPLDGAEPTELIINKNK